MADNTTLNPGTGGDVIATDDIGGVKYQIVKVSFGALDTATPASAANPLPVVQTGTHTVTGAGGTFPVTDSAGSLTVDAPVATPVFVRLSDGAAAISALPITDNAGSITVDGTVAATQSGTWSVRNQDGSGNSITSATRGSERALTVQVVDGSGAQVTAFSGSGTPSVVSSVNSTAVVLSGAAAFTGTSEDVTLYASATVSVIASHASATDGLSMQQSSDGTNWDIVDAYTVPAATGKTFGVQISAKFFRVVYTNGATLQTSFRLQTMYHTNMQNSSSVRPQDARTNDNDMTEVLAYGVGFNGTTWDRLRTVNTGMLQVAPTYAGTVQSTGVGASGAQTPRVVTATDSTIGTVTAVTTVSTVTNVATIGTSVTPGTAAANLGKAIDSVVGATDTGVAALFTRTDTLATVTPAVGDYVNPRVNSLGAQWVQIAGGSIAGIADDAAFIIATSEVLPVGHLADETATDSVDEGDVGLARMTLDRKTITTEYVHAAAGGTSAYNSISAAAVLSAVIKASPGKVFSVQIFNLNAAARYVRLYNQTGAPASTDGANILWRGIIPGNTAGAGFTATLKGMQFSTGIGIRASAAVADNDTTVLAANELFFNVEYV